MARHKKQRKTKTETTDNVRQLFPKTFATLEREIKKLESKLKKEAKAKLKKVA